MAKTDPMLSFWTFSLTGERIAFSVATTVDANVEDALIKGWLWYAIPFDQWRIYTIAARERRALEKLGLLQQYQKAQTSVAAVLYQARARAYLLLSDLRPRFELRSRSAATIRKDVKERNELMRLLDQP